MTAGNLCVVIIELMINFWTITALSVGPPISKWCALCEYECVRIAHKSKIDGRKYS